MKYHLKINVPGLPKTTNGQSRAHWTKLHREAQKWHRLVLISMDRNAPAEPLKKAKLTLTRHSSTEPDFDGLVSSFKHVTDSLIKCGVIEDDKMSVIGQPIFKWVKCRPKHGHITVEVESIDE